MLFVSLNTEITKGQIDADKAMSYPLKFWGAELNSILFCD